MGDSNYQKLPPGWDCKYDQATGNCYYINYFTKAMQLEDPRMRYKQLQNERCSTESIPLQSMHTNIGGGSPYHVYPSNNLPAMRAFQTSSAANSTLQNISSSPLLSSRGNLEMSPLPFTRSITPRPMAGNMSRRSTIQETSFTNQIDTDAVVTKIQNMFPTASDNHIRMLLKRYYNHESLVISALQVEKHPVTMPGPFVTPPAQRHLFHSNSALQMTPPARRPDFAVGAGRGLGYVPHGLGGSSTRTASPVPAAVTGARYGSVVSMHSGSVRGVGISADASSGYAQAVLPPFHAHRSPRFTEQWRSSSPKPHSSPKMKLRYMKNIFPKADEMLLLDILAGVDNNVQRASEQLIALGYVKREFVPPKISNRSDGAPKKPGDEQIIPLRPKEYTQAEKDAMQIHLKEKYPQIAERIILMALESVSYAEDRAIQILQIVREEDETRARKSAAELQTTTELDETVVDGLVVASSGIANKHSQRGSTEEEELDHLQQPQEFKSLLGRIATMGHNTELTKGADENLLLADYVTWNGANPDINFGHKQSSAAVGPNASLLLRNGGGGGNSSKYTALGRNPELCKGAKVGPSSLAKGSIYAGNIKCN